MESEIRKSGKVMILEMLICPGEIEKISNAIQKAMDDSLGGALSDSQFISSFLWLTP